MNWNNQFYKRTLSRFTKQNIMWDVRLLIPFNLIAACGKVIFWCNIKTWISSDSEFFVIIIIEAFDIFIVIIFIKDLNVKNFVFSQSILWSISSQKDFKKIFNKRKTDFKRKNHFLWLITPKYVYYSWSNIIIFLP